MEIVIENPSESRSVAPSNASGHVATVAAAAAAAVSAMSETGTMTTATTTVVTIATTLDATLTTTTATAQVATASPSAITTTTTATTTNFTHNYLRSPRCNPIIYGNQSSAAVITEQDYYLTQRSPRPLSSIDDFDGGISTMRRVDRSGLLEISSLDHPTPSSSSSSSPPPPPPPPPSSSAASASASSSSSLSLSLSLSSRYRQQHCRPIGAESIAGHAGTLPRRVDRSGLLEALPELPENRTSSEELIRSTYGVKEVTMIKPDVVALVRSPTYDTSTRFSTPSPSLLRPNECPSPGTISRISPTANLTRRTADGDSSLTTGNERTIRYRSATSDNAFIPIESTTIGLTATRYPYADKKNFSSCTRIEDEKGKIERIVSNDTAKDTAKDERDDTNSEYSTKDENIGNYDKEDNDVPRGERAEAEGCENTASENHEEGRVSFQNPNTNNKLYHNDNVQTLTVIILSEQL